MENTNTTEQQAPSPKVHIESAAPEQIPVTSNQSPTQTPSASGTAAQSLLASEQTVETDVWNMADELYAQVRKAEAETSERHHRIHGESFFRSIIENSSVQPRYIP